LAAIIVLLSTSAASGYGGDDLEEAAKETENPLSGVIKVQVQNSTSYIIGPNERARNTLALSPTIPVHLGSLVTLNATVRIPLVWNPLVMTPNDSAFGLADVGVNLPFTVTLRDFYFVGLGPSFLIPTGTDNRLGKSVSGRFSLGPAASFQVTPWHLVLGISVSNVWSVAGLDSGRTVNAFSLIPVATWNLPRGFYVTSSLPVAADWAAPSDDRWTFSFGGGLGGVNLFTKKVGISYELQAYWNIVQTSVDGLWQLRIAVTIFFPQLAPER
jgi:hypothetical protein